MKIADIELLLVKKN